MRNVICVDSAGQAIVDDEFAAMACGSLIKPKDNIALAKPLDICSRKDPAGLEAESRPCSGHGTCVSQSFEAEQGGILTKSSCVCEVGCRLSRWQISRCSTKPMSCADELIAE